MLDLSFEGLEHMVWEFFAELEKRADYFKGLNKKRGISDKGKLLRELRNLYWGLSYGKGVPNVGEETRRRARRPRSGAK